MENASVAVEHAKLQDGVRSLRIRFDFGGIAGRTIGLWVCRYRWDRLGVGEFDDELKIATLVGAGIAELAYPVAILGGECKREPWDAWPLRRRTKP